MEEYLLRVQIPSSGAITLPRKSKPFRVKAWHADLDFSLEELHTVPIWIKLPGLDFKYWSPKGLSKLGSLIGKPLMVDQNTERKIGLNFARLMVEGGLNIKGCENWNEASVAPANSSWYWRKLNSLKTKMQHWYTQGQLNLTANGEYSITSGYLALLDHREKLKRLLTKERLIQVATTECCLCQEAVLETNKHLFVECEYVTRKEALEEVQEGSDSSSSVGGAMVWKASNWKHFKGTSIQHADIVGILHVRLKQPSPSYGMKGGAHTL
ncbi:hypothetical protein H5410_049262 [Solanum commersonii]|uniref:DUF4283 domain-containing protein n=1 Tax=Solanum commersonii TaxID=4109 RepID=A0A9J5XNA5_SOLCO|nr:hypothetical protein H5410_049262 [Solanum commersonii]